MHISIEYCGVWNYLPKASSLKADLENNFPDIQIELIESSGGVFEVKKDGELIFSKKQLGRFPEHEEIFASLKWLTRWPFVAYHSFSLHAARQKMTWI